MLRINKQGFTLIELMVVIVIIGVLASLAIPRFTEASAKAKAAEAPRVLASYESAYLAAVAELPSTDIEAGVPIKDLVFEVPKDSKWWGYAGGEPGGAGTIDNTATKLEAKAAEKGMGAMSDKTLATEYDPDTDAACFKHSVDGGADSDGAVKKMLPNFFNACSTSDLKS